MPKKKTAKKPPKKSPKKAAVPQTPGQRCMAALTRKYPDSSYTNVIVNDEFAAADSAVHGHVCVEAKDL